MSDLHPLLERTLAGDAEAWRDLQAQVEPTIVAIARGHSGLRSRGLGGASDDVREVAVATLERLARDDFRNLRRFLEGVSAAETGATPAPNFDAWLYGAVDFVIRDHLRSRYGRAPKAAPSGEAPVARPSKRDAHSLAGRFADSDADGGRVLLHTVGMTTKLTAAEVFEHIDRQFAPDEARALRLYYLEDQGFSEIARALGLPDDKSADKLIRRLNGRLRYHFGVDEDNP